MIKCLAVFICVSVVSVRTQNSSADQDLWNAFKTTCGKTYVGAENDVRMSIYLANKKSVEFNNKQYEAKQVSFKTKLSCMFSDWKKMEFHAIALGYDNDYTKSGLVLKDDSRTPPDSWDWRTLIDDKPMNQGLCSCAYSLLSTECIEDQIKIRTGQNIDLSAQELIDCSLSSGNLACDGGRMEYSYKYIKERGISKECDYPFTGVVGPCKKQNASAPVQLVGFADVQEQNEQDLKRFVMYGPVSAAIDGSSWYIYHYDGGVYCEPECSSYDLSMPVKVMGFGTDNNGTDYWIIKSYFGPDWGENGYMRLRRNYNNHCGIATKATIPIIKI